MRRRVVVPSLHRRYIANMVGMFGDCALHGAAALQRAHQVRRVSAQQQHCWRLPAQRSADPSARMRTIAAAGE